MPVIDPIIYFSLSALIGSFALLWWLNRDEE